MTYSFMLTLPDWVGAFLAGEPKVFADLEHRMKLAITLSSLNVEHQTGGPFGAAIFDHSSGSNTWGSLVRGNATEALLMGSYGDGTPLPKRAAVSVSGFTGNTFHYDLTSSSDTTYSARSYVPACQITIANRPPSVNAGSDQILQHPTNAANLSGSASDDGLPDPPGTFTTTWSKVSGSGTVTFGNPNALNTTATFSEFGTYILRLEANDGALSRSDFVTIIYKQNSNSALFIKDENCILSL